MPFDCLPLEILTLIAGHLETVHDVFRLLQTNRMLYSLLVDRICKMNVESDGGSALVWYSCKGNEAGVRRMLAMGADVNVRPLSRDQSTALLGAVHHKHTRVVEILLQNGAAPDAADLRSRRPLTVAAGGSSDIAIAQLLLAHGAKVDAIPSDKRAPLLEAIRTNQIAKVNVLLKHGANAHTIQDRHGMNLLHVAAGKNASPAIIAMLIGLGISVDSRDGYDRTPLGIAIHSSSTRAVQVLLQNGANPNTKERSGLSAIFRAIYPTRARSPNTKIINMLLMHGADIDCRGPMNLTPFLYAISQGAMEKARALLGAGANVGLQNTRAESVLHVAVASLEPSLDMMTWLVENGADVNQMGGRALETPLLYAIAKSTIYRKPEDITKIAAKLLSLGADVDCQNANGLTPLSLASRMGSIDLSQLLIQNGACIDSRDMQSQSPVHHVLISACTDSSKKREMAVLLLQHGADVNARDIHGYTPLHRALAGGLAWEVVEELLQAGANPCAMSNDGKFPSDMIPNGPFAEAQRLMLCRYLA